MLAIARLQGQLDVDERHADLHALAVVLDVDHVDAIARKQRKQPHERSRPVVDLRAQHEVATGVREPGANHVLQQPGIEIAAREHAHHPLSARIDAAAEQCRDADGARALDQQLGPLEQHHDGVHDLVLGHVDDVVDESLDDREGDVPGSLDRDAVRDRAHVRRLGRPAALEGGPVRRAARRLHADDATVGAQRLHHRRNPGEQPAAPEGNDEHVDLGHVLEHLEGEGALPGHDQGIVERAHERPALALCRGLRRSLRVVERLALEHDGRAVAAGRGLLGERCTDRHVDGGGDAEGACRERNALRVVARTRGDDPGFPLGRRQVGEPVGGAADLERARLLQVLGLEQDLGARPVRERGRREHGRVQCDAVEPGPRGEDVVEADHRRRESSVG